MRHVQFKSPAVLQRPFVRRYIQAALEHVGARTAAGGATPPTGGETPAEALLGSEPACKTATSDRMFVKACHEGSCYSRQWYGNARA